MKKLAKIFAIITIVLYGVIILDLSISAVITNYGSFIWTLIYENGVDGYVNNLINAGATVEYVNMFLNVLYILLISITVVPLTLAILLLIWLNKDKKGMGFAIGLIVCSLPYNIIGILAGIFALCIKINEKENASQPSEKEKEEIILSSLRSAELDKLEQMYQAGQVTEEQYNDLKRRILTK